MEAQKDKQTHQDAHAASETKLTDEALKNIPYDNSRVGQASVIIGGVARQKSIYEMTDKELNHFSFESCVEAVMKRSGKSREEVVRMMSDPF
jgi:hypothetical protein